MSETGPVQRPMNGWLAVAIAVWTLAAWGGRIGLLGGDEGAGAWVRIGGSLLIGLIAAATLVVSPLHVARKPALLVFGAFSVILWARSLVVNWIGSGSLPFKLVHTLLAIGFFALAVWATSVALSSTGGDPVAAPNEAHGQQEG